MTSENVASGQRGARGHVGALLTLGLPLVGSHLAQFAITMTDTVMVGWYDVTALAGLVLAGTLYYVAFLVGSGFAWAVMPMVASAVGSGDERMVRRATRMGLWLSICFGALVTPLLFWSEALFILLGQQPDVAQEGALYLKIAVIGLTPNLLIMVLKSYFSALERTQIVLWVTLASAVLNAVANYALIFGNWGMPELGIRGAAIASVILQIFGLAVLVVYAIRKTPEYGLFQNFHRPDWDAFGKVFKLGWPIGLTNLAEVGLFSAASVLMGWVGTFDLAAHGIALQISSATFMVHVGLSQAVTIRAGRAHGRGDEAHLRAGAAWGLALSAIVVFVTVILFLTIPEILVGSFLSPSDPARPEIIAIGAMLLAIAALFQLVDAAQVMALGMLRGVQDTRVPMILAIVSYWVVGLPASYLLGFPAGLEGIGIWLGLVVGLALSGILLNWRFWARSSRIGGTTPA